MKAYLGALAAALVSLGTTALAQDAPRFRPLSVGELNDAQRKVYEEIAGGPRGGVRGPFNALLRSPQLTDRAQRMGEYIRFNSSLPPRLNEFAILITARHWSSQYEWYAHHPLALKAGLAPGVASDLAQRRRPAAMQDDEAAVYDFCTELHEKKFVSDATYKAVLERFGERGVVDLIGVSGYYTLVSMVLNVDRHPAPENLLAGPPTQVMNIVREADIKFQPARYPGIQSAVISGSLTAPGQPYVQRNKFSPGTFSPPHFHPETRYIVVLKGTWWVGSGPKWDKENTTPVPAGSFVVHHANQIHYDGAKDEEVVLQIMGIGPSATIPVDESGQPKR